MDQHPRNAAAQELHRLGELFAEVASSLSRLASALAAAAETSAASPQVSPEDAGAEDWDSIIQAAIRLLLEQPEREWRPAELFHALEKEGIPRNATALMLMPRLRARNAIVYGPQGRFRAHPTLLGAPVPTEVPASPRPPPAPRPERNWERITEEAMRILQREPGRVWKPAELSRAVLASGIQGGQLRGLHFGLIPRLRSSGVIDELEGGFRAAAAQQAEPQAVSARPPLVRRPGEGTATELDQEPEPRP